MHLQRLSSFESNYLSDSIYNMCVFLHLQYKLHVMYSGFGDDYFGGSSIVYPCLEIPIKPLIST